MNRSSGTRGGGAALTLRRRGVAHGRSRPRDRQGLADHELEARWADARPLLLPGALRDSLPAQRGAVRASLALFERLRRGASFQDEVRARLGRSRIFRPGGAEVDTGDPREIEKVFVDARRAGRTVAARLYAKLSWIASDPQDGSLRIRFSFGSETLRDWQRETRRAPWAARYAEALFPECAAVTGNTALVARVEGLVGRALRFSERIVYSNAPGGGAVFHHDDEPWQHGVLFSQLAGETAWLALPRLELEQELAGFAREHGLMHLATPARARRALESEGDREVLALLNHTPLFTRRLAAAGHLLHLRAGDALLLPNHGPRATCWHSVFALGARASLAHSYGLFARRR